MSKENTTFWEKRKTLVIVGLAVLLLVFIAKVIYDAVEKNRLIEETEATSIELQNAYYQLDSVQAEVEIKIATIEELGGQVDTLLKIREELREEKATLQRRSRKEIFQLSEKVQGYTELLLAKDVEIEQLKKVNDILLGENTNLKNRQNRLQRSISTLEETKSKLQEQVTIAARLEITTPTIEGINHKGAPLRRLRAATVKALKISFSVKANEVAEADGKEILLRILAPNGKVLFDVRRGAGSFLMDGKETFYTLKQDILYNKHNQDVSFLYEKQSHYSKGIYQVEVYTEGYLMGTGQFELK